MIDTVGFDLSAARLEPSAAIAYPRVCSVSSANALDVPSLLSEVGVLYPNFDNWLRARLTDVSQGRAQASIVRIQGAIVGVTINSPKTAVRHKLSTIYVDPAFRGAGLGHLLLRQQMLHWQAVGARNYVVTVRENRAEPVARLCWHYGIQPIAIEHNRYGAGQHEVILAKKGVPTWVALF